jgi:hypothetical protein
MNLGDLHTAFAHLTLPSDSYSLNGGRPEGGFAIKREGIRWIIYYSERGSRFDIEKFDNEDSACRRLWDLVTNGQPLPEDLREMR